MRKSLIAASMLSLTVAMAPACATKKYVRTEVGTVNSKVDTLSGTVEQTQGRVQQTEARIGEVDTKAEAAGKAPEGAVGDSRHRSNEQPAAQLERADFRVRLRREDTVLRAAPAAEPANIRTASQASTAVPSPAPTHPGPLVI